MATNGRTVTVFGGTGFLVRRIVRHLRYREFRPDRVKASIVGKVSLALMIRNFIPPQTLDTELSDTLGCALINIIRVVQ